MAPVQGISGKLQAMFTAPVLAAVAELPQETIDAEESLSPAFVDRILGKTDLDIGKVTYGIG